MSLYEEMNFKGIIISPVTRPIEDWKWRERWDLKEKLEKTFSKYGSATCSYVSLSHEPSLHSYQDNYAIIDFKNKNEASEALGAIENGSIDYKSVLTAKPLDENYCPIGELVDECLFRIFEFLPIHERLKLSEVCERWRIVSTRLWRDSRRIDVREKLRGNKNEDFVMKSGPNLREIYCFDDYGLKTIKKSCKNLENVSIEFRKYTTINGIDRACIRFERAALLQFKNLKRLMLKIRDSRYTYFSFLQYLPSSMLEIHLINDIKWPLYEYDDEGRKHVENMEKYGKKLIDLSKFVELKALTLEHYMLDEDSLIGIEKLKKLICLCLDHSTLSPSAVDKLKFLNSLRHLSLKRVSMDYDDAWLMIKRNKYLEYLGVPRINDLKHNDMWLRVMELEHVRILSYVDTPGKIRELGVSRNVQYLELYSVHISNRMIEALIEEAFPNLKVLKYHHVWGYSSYETGRMKHAVLARDNKNLLRYCGGKMSRHYQHDRILDWSSDNFEFCETLPEEDAKILRCYGWSGWYIEEDNSNEPMAKPSSRRTSAISKLSNNLISKIIDYLPIDDKINASRVCRGWRNIFEKNSRDLLGKFDVRELSRHSNREQCFIHFGKYFEDVYYFSGCGLSVLENYCCNVESLALDYRFRVCECTKKATYKICYDLKWLRPLLLVMKNLSRLMLKDVNVFTSDIFEHLPETLVEIHVFHKSEVFGVNRSKKVAKIKYGAFHIDLSRFTNLRALTLLETDLPYERPCTYAVEVTGVEKLEELTYLCMSEDIFANDCEKIGNISKLEYLSIKHCNISSVNLVRLLENNENLQYLDIEEITEDITDALLKSILSLRRLKYLRLKKKDSTMEYSDPPVNLDFINGMKNLELLDIENDLLLPKEVVLNLIASSPKLKAVNLPINGTFFGEDMLTIAENNVVKRRDNCKIQVFLGVRGQKLMETSGLRPPHVIIGNVPPQEYFELIKESWRGWYTDESAKIPKIIGKLLRSIN